MVSFATSEALPGRAAAALAIPIVLIVATSAAAQTRAERDRLAHEARTLFQAVEHSPTDVGQCTFEREWDGRPVLAKTAERHLKQVVRADLVVSDPPASIMQALDPEGLRPEMFCREREREMSRRDKLAGFRDRGGAVLRFVTIGYSFPVFNADYTRAALVVQRHVDSHVAAPDGKLKQSMETQGGAEIYEKRAGAWHRIAYDSYFTVH
jgi:hypothetical protein